MNDRRHNDMLSDHDLLMRIDDRLARLHARLFGPADQVNGGGEIGVLKRRVGAIERWRWLLTGGLLAILGAAEFVYHLMLAKQ